MLNRLKLLISDKPKVKAVSALFFGNSGSMIIYMASLLILGVILNKVDFGYFRVGYTYITISIGVALLGLNTSITKYLPELSTSQKRCVIYFCIIASLCGAVVAGVAIYALMPREKANGFDAFELLNIISFPIAVFGGSMCQITLAILQSENKFFEYSRLQFQWRLILFSFAIGGGLMGNASQVFILMSLSYIIIFYFIYSHLRHVLAATPINDKMDWSGVHRVVRSAFWPLAAICTSTFYANAEFLFLKNSDMSTGLAGSYSYASLIFVGGAAFFLPFQTYAGAMIVTKKMGLIGLLNLQLLCFFSVAAIAGLSIFFARFLNHLDPGKFDIYFVDFSYLVAIKLALWGSYAVTGSVLNFIGKEFEAFLIVLLGVAIIIIAPNVFDISYALRDIVLMQIATAVFILIGSTALVISGLRGR